MCYKFIMGLAPARPPIIIIISHTIGDADLREKEDDTLGGLSHTPTIHPQFKALI